MIVLGINENHNATAALIKDGKVIYAASEERISRFKNDVGYPFQTIARALEETGISPKEIDYVAYTTQTPGTPAELKIKRITNFSIGDYIREMREYWKPIFIDKQPAPPFWENLMEEKRFQNPGRDYYDFSFLKTAPKDQWPAKFNEARIKVAVGQLGIAREKILFMNHHLCHASYAYYAAPVDRSKKIAVVTADGWGDNENGTVYLAEGGKLKKIHSTNMCNLARIYRYMTLVLGMKPYEHEYKVMGLAPYAKKYLTDQAYAIFKKTLVVDGLDFKWLEKPTDLYFYFKDKLEGVRFDGIAGGVQQWVEDMAVQWITNILNRLRVDSLVLSGGFSMNVKANKAIGEIPQLKYFFVAPSGGDESTAIGAAYAVSAEHGITPQPLEHAYLGYKITDREVRELLEKYNIRSSYSVKENVSSEEVAGLLAENKIIARCANRMEFGARSLGNRAILCNPSDADNIRVVNERIKFRDFWMPFTPSILDYRAKDYLVNPKQLPGPYMTLAFDSTELARKDIRAALHPYDFTARPQVLTKEANPSYYDLLQAFEKLTGIGGVLNTSLNLHGEPIVWNAEDAWHTFVNSGLDALLLNETLIIKK